MTDRMKALTYELELLERSLADPDILTDAGRYREVMQRYSEVKAVVDVDAERRGLEKQLAGLGELLDDPDLAEEASREATELETRIHELEAELGVRPPWALESFEDPYADTRQSMQRLKLSPFVPHKDNIRGFVYDVDNGRLDEVESA